GLAQRRPNLTPMGFDPAICASTMVRSSQRPNRPKEATVSEADWRNANRTNWDERVAVHLGPRGYDLTDLRAGQGRLHRIEEAELPPLAGKRVLHLQCHFGADSLRLTQRGATVVGLDFAPPAIAAAGRLASEVGLADRARFVQADLYDAPAAIPEPAAFDIVFVT